MDPFGEITLIVALAAILGIIAKVLKQPLIVAYIACGILAGPFLFDMVSSTETLSLFSHIGISLLLFIVGLGLSPYVIREVGKASLITGIGQILFTAIVGFGICTLLGFTLIESIYLSIAITFSSTIIIMKLLSDRGDTETLYGKISMGFLIIQDVVVIFILIFVSAMQSAGGMGSFFVQSAANGIILLAAIYLIAKYVFPKISGTIARSQENLVAFSVAWCLVAAFVFHHFGFSMEIGALLAGVALSGSVYRLEIMSRMRALRDFFLILFFVLLGTQMQFADVSSKAFEIGVLSLFILIGNPIIVFLIMMFLGHTARNGFMAGLTVAQISEFSIILMALGIRVGHLDQELLSVITLVGIITITGSVYMILYSDRIYSVLSGVLEKFQRRGHPKLTTRKNAKIDIILFGHNHIGYGLVDSLLKRTTKFMVVDHNPQAIGELRQAKINYAYGDASDMDFVGELPLKQARLFISTIHDFDTNVTLVRQIKKANKKAIIFVVSHDMKEALKLYAHGASYVVLPHFLGGKHLAYMLKRFYSGTLNNKKEIKRYVHHLQRKLTNGHKSLAQLKASKHRKK